ncbi:hypothetical protein [Pedobacter sp. BMA]|uniref:hypothetical protein n=1 Tax=Pedobacter sp. BMA TaxID=1663685 RepID=UPI000AB47B68|nr:hypothetical protein [Pedobacter sp. BMA]
MQPSLRQQADSAKVNHLKEVKVQRKKIGIVNSSASPYGGDGVVADFTKIFFNDIAVFH